MTLANNGIAQFKVEDITYIDVPNNGNFSVHMNSGNSVYFSGIPISDDPKNDYWIYDLDLDVFRRLEDVHKEIVSLWKANS